MVTFKFQGFLNAAGATALMQSPPGEPGHGASKNLAHATAWDRVVAETLLEVATAHGRPMAALQPAEQAGAVHLQSASIPPASEHAAGHRPSTAAAVQTGDLLPNPIVAAQQSGSNGIGQTAADPPPALPHLYKAGPAEPQPSGLSSTDNGMQCTGGLVHQGRSSPSSQLHQQLPKDTEHEHADDVQTATAPKGSRLPPAAKSFTHAARQAAEAIGRPGSALPAAGQQGTTALEDSQGRQQQDEGADLNAAKGHNLGSDSSRPWNLPDDLDSPNPPIPGFMAASEGMNADTLQAQMLEVSRAQAGAALGLTANVKGSSSHVPAEGQASAAG